MLQPPPSPNPDRQAITSVSDFVLRVRQTLEACIPLGWIAGEVSNLVRAASGHVYFTLKDERAQIRCVMWRTRAQLLAFQLREGMQVEVRALPTIYEPRGDLQLSVETIRRAGQGNLYEAFLRLKAKLAEEGLFDAARRRSLPTLPRGLGVVTSPAAAAWQDVLTALRRRAPALPVVLYPTPVQGDGAGERIAQAIQTASARAAQDGISVLIVCRGGGSIEDLWAFNHELVARAIAACSIPVVSGVGHETDTTLADFAADMRAPTPTAAAELVSSGWHALASQLPKLEQALLRAITQHLHRASQRLDLAQRRLTHPRARLQRNAERLERLQQRLQSAQAQRLLRLHARLDRLDARLHGNRPRTEALRARLDARAQALQRSMHRCLESAGNRLAQLGTSLTLLNPDAILQRGYAIVRDEAGQIVRQEQDMADDALLDIQLATSRLKARVSRT